MSLGGGSTCAYVGVRFKHIPGELRTKLQEKATPCVYLGVDASTRTYLLGSLYELHLTTAVDVTFVDGEFPFRGARPVSAASLLWGNNPPITEGDHRLGQFDEPVVDKSLYKSFGLGIRGPPTSAS